MPLDPDIKQRAQGPNFAALTTLMPDGQPQTQVMWVDADDEHVLINTELGRQKQRNVERDPRVTVTIIDRDDPYSYARRTMVNASIDWWRRIGRHERLVQAAPEPVRRAGRDPADAAEDRAVLHQALALLTRKERAVVVLRFYDDLTEEQTARELGVAVGTVKSTCHRALRKLRDGVGQQREMEGTA